jgi:hypothetical protein
MVVHYLLDTERCPCVIEYDTTKYNTQLSASTFWNFDMDYMYTSEPYQEPYMYIRLECQDCHTVDILFVTPIPTKFAPIRTDLYIPLIVSNGSVGSLISIPFRSSSYKFSIKISFYDVNMKPIVAKRFIVRCSITDAKAKN